MSAESGNPVFVAVLDFPLARETFFEFAALRNVLKFVA
jgi:hypothetical protein